MVKCTLSIKSGVSGPKQWKLGVFSNVLVGLSPMVLSDQNMACSDIPWETLRNHGSEYIWLGNHFNEEKWQVAGSGSLLRATRPL